MSWLATIDIEIGICALIFIIFMFSEVFLKCNKTIKLKSLDVLLKKNKFYVLYIWIWVVEKKKK